MGASTAIPRPSSLPPSLPPAGINREQAAEFIGVSTTTFDKMVDDGRMPKPKCVGTRKIWDVRKLARAFARLPGDEEDERNPFDEMT